jgi:hypothetical protein
MAAKRVLVRRGLLDITHGLRLPPLPGAWTARRGGLPASNSLDAAGGESSSRTGAMT